MCHKFKFLVLGTMGRGGQQLNDGFHPLPTVSSSKQESLKFREDKDVLECLSYTF